MYVYELTMSRSINHANVFQPMYNQTDV